MEKFFIISNDTDLAKDYLEYKNNRKIVHEHVNSFMEKYEIKSQGYNAGNETFYIDPTKEDIEKYDKILGKEVDNGLRPFKKSSKIHKEWIKSLKDNDIKVKHKPHIAWYFKDFVGGRYSSKLFDIDGVVYCSFRWDGNVDCPEGFIELKASEFWKIVEDNK
jgi:hypothetical protein